MYPVARITASASTSVPKNIEFRLTVRCVKHILDVRNSFQTIFEHNRVFCKFLDVRSHLDRSTNDSVGQFIVDGGMLGEESMLWLQTVLLVVEPRVNLSFSQLGSDFES